MKKFLPFHIAFFLVSTLCNAQTIENDIVIKALRDQVQTTLDSLKLPGYEKPFFVMLGAQSEKTYRMVSILGAMNISTEDVKMDRTSSRILVGDYGFNDESLEDDLFAPTTPHDIAMPERPDYWGIRRSFWSSIDNVYREGAHHVENHKRAVRESGKKLSEIPHRTFAKGVAVTIAPDLHSYTFPKAQWEQKLRRLSSIFLNHPSIISSYVALSFADGMDYLVTSEKTVVRQPVMKTLYFVHAQAKTPQGDPVDELTTLYLTSPDEMPDEKTLAAQIEAQIVRVEEKVKASALADEYTGPVLMIGDGIVDILGQALLSGSKESITTNDKIPSLIPNSYEPEYTSLASRMNKLVANEALTVKAKPTLKAFQGTNLNGSFQIDREGIVPANEIVLIEKGILKNFLNNRTLTDSVEKANGLASGPGVLEVTVDKRFSDKELKDKLIKKAIEEGLDHAFIIRNKPAYGAVDVYSVSVIDGKETLLRDGQVTRITMKTLKKILGASDKSRVINNPIASFIVPDAMLFGEIEINPRQRRGNMKEEEYVKSPLK